MSNPARPRASGVLLHPTSLPGPYGIGDLGPAAYQWVEALAKAGQTWWQVLPLGPTGYGDSPYQSFSAFAGNPNLISLELLVRDGLLTPAQIPAETFPEGEVDYDRVSAFKSRLLTLAAAKFHANILSSMGGSPLGREYKEFCARESHWLNDYALFMDLKKAHRGAPWWDWPEAFALRVPAFLRDAPGEDPILDLHRIPQFLFFRQWDALKKHANSLGLRLIGDLPIFVAEDSADVWAHPELFLLDEHRRPRVVAGVPPDYFSATGQLWGNPHYDWDRMRADGFAWWKARARATLRLVDRVRLDHFRGFCAAWQVPAGDPTAQNGHWVPGPGEELFAALRQELGGLPFIAEDLGVITPDVDGLRTRLGLPGMRILQFAFGGAVEERFLPHNYDADTVVYTGTHDNDTTAGWFEGLTPAERDYFLRYAPGAGADPAWALIRLAWASVAETAVAPVQDLLRLGSAARMNRPGVPSGNWRWRLRPDEPLAAALDRLGELTAVYQRRPG
jgi:4-alpha-glucanotransferase